MPILNQDAAMLDVISVQQDHGAMRPGDEKPTLRAESAQRVSDCSETFEHPDVADRAQRSVQERETTRKPLGSLVLSSLFAPVNLPANRPIIEHGAQNVHPGIHAYPYSPLAGSAGHAP